MIRKRWHAVLDRLPKSSEGTFVRAVEVGVWDGRMSEQLLRSRGDLILTMVDRWTPPEPDDSYFSSGAQIARKPAEDHEKAHHDTLARVGFAGERARIMRLHSVTAAEGVFEPQDMVFLDADHSKLGVTSDLLAWWPKVKAGGWIGGHDWDHPNQGQVKAAVEWFFEQSGLDIELDDNRTWFVRKPD